MVEPAKMLFYNKVMDRTAIKQLISRLMAHFDITYTTHILDQLKNVGFEQATQAAISLGIDDLLTAPSKGWLIQDAEQQGYTSEKNYRYGNVHAVEKLRQLIETWYATSEYLKQEMNPNFRMTDPLNPVHMMSFSGARGSTSQVHQLVGMRGLMSDPQGQIIDLPIQSNFREGLSLTEYIISCYGARKGVVDTAVRTSDAGYLTRRLVEVVQHIVIRKVNCGTFEGIFVTFSYDTYKKNNYQQKLIGRILAENIYINNRCIAIRNQDITVNLALFLVDVKKKSIFIRSPLTCKSMLWICQLCYGWSLTHGNLIELGEAVGIIAGQSIGEPGTQLTLRTFHTGGVFTGDIAEHIRTPFNGIVKFDTNLVYPTRTRHGHPAWICNNNLSIIIKSKKKFHNFTIPPQSMLLIQNNQYVESKQIIAEIRAKISPFKEKVQKYIYSNLSGEMHWSTKVQHAPEYIHSNVHLLCMTSHIWILAGHFEKPSESFFIFYRNQDKLDNKLPISNKILGYYYYYKNKKNFLDSFWNFIHSSIIFYTYNFLGIKKRKKKNFFFYKNKKAFGKKPIFPFILKIKKNGILKENDIFAIFDDPKYRIRNSGIIKYGTIKVDFINKKKDFFGNSENKNTRSKYRIIKEGNFFFIPEEVYYLDQSLFYSILVKNNSFIKTGTRITSTITSKVTGFVKIKEKNNNFEIKILPGSIYYPKEKPKIFKQNGILIPPGKKIFEQFRAKLWIYLEWIVLSKENSFFFIRPAIEYKIKSNDNSLNLPIPFFIDFLKEQQTVEIKTIKYLFYQNDEEVQFINNTEIQLVQNCLILNWKTKVFLKEAHISFVKIIRLAKPYLTTGRATIHNNYGEIVKEGDTLITLVYERSKSGDIIQGLPKVEQLLEARPINSVFINLEKGFEDWNKDMINFFGSLWGYFLSARISMEQSQLNLVDQIRKVYRSQGVQISDKHIEIIVRQMTSKVITLEDGLINGFLPGELVEFTKIKRMNRSLEEIIPYKPLLLGITKASLNTQSFISEASFQETTRVLAKAALRGRIDWLKGLKENVILGGIVPTGTGCQEVIWEIILEKEKNILLKKKNRKFFQNKVKNIFLCKNFSIFFTSDQIHRKLKQQFFKITTNK
uniref:RNA polymerase beta'' subunit n=1 Tax=Ptychomnion cygnisetum TaxID=245469 RepID=UPI001D11FB5F|nr:RNA polymerase beta'' subunit [Ptychomnion cygnisetum]QZJ47827.1 RNA polymerase beta'' subunit [Ptychomnion cygnisetum]